jgi:ferric-dicitrate binding protein FerR (iron transport regulator)
MTCATSVRAVPGLAACVLAAWSGGASAQIAGCQLGPTPEGRQVLRCGDFKAVLEPGTDVRAVDANRDGAPDALQLANRGVLVDYEAPGRRGFQILTPHAIAAVRGTTWAVSVEGGRTSVFVVEGQVTVARAAAGRHVLLRAGEGVDVDGGGSGPLRVASWSRERVAALLARFGRR